MFLLFFIQPDLRVTDGTAAATELAGTPQRMGKCREISPETVHGASSLMASFHNLGNYIYYSFFKIHMVDMLFSGISLCPPYTYVGTGKSRFKKLQISYLKSSHV